MQTHAPNIETSDVSRQPTFFPASFTTNGASTPTVLGGHVESVIRLETAAPRPFFRIRFKELIPNLSSARTVITTGFEGPENTDATINVSRAGFTANPADAIEAGRELDVQLLEAGTAVDTAGRRISVFIWIDQGE